MPGQTVQITTADGRMGAHLSRPAAGAGPFPGVLVVMEAFGLNDHIRAVADRIAADGYLVLAPDLYYREPDRIAGYGELPKAIGLMGKLEDDSIVADVRSAIDFLKAEPGIRPDRIGMTGFCMGGRVTMLAATRLPIQAAAPFYGGGIAGLLGAAEGIACPMVLFFGGKDAYIPQGDVEKIRARLASLGKRAEVVVYPDADHGFFCDERPSYDAAAATDAWRRLTKLFAENLKS
jgi:carboxymethylenebutenolidase